jgi:hypothetical protein
MAKLGDKKTALEGLEAFEALFVAADAKARISMYSFVPQLMETCGSKEKPVAQSARALATLMYVETPAWSGGYVLPFLKESLSPKAKPEVKSVACDNLATFAKKYPESMALEIEWCVHLLSILMNDIKKRSVHESEGSYDSCIAMLWQPGPAEVHSYNRQGSGICKECH